MSTGEAGKARDAALAGALTQIERQFGKGSVMRMGDEGAQVRVEGIPTGALSLDLALGIGGMPRGRIVEIYGPESSGKTTLVYHVIAEAQKLGGICAFIDAEHAMDPLYAREIGVDIDELLVSQPDYGEQALEIADMLIRSGAVDVVAIDSVAALTPRSELEGQMGDQTVGLQARMMSQALRKLAGNLNRANTMCLFTNQIREKIGVMFGSPETQPGGRALKFYASQRLDIRRIETLKDGTEAVGNRVRVKVVKNKVARAVPPGRVRHRVRQGHLDRGLHPRPRHRARHRHEVGLVLLLQRRAPRPGPQQRQGVPRRAPGDRATEIEDKIYEALGISRDPLGGPRRRRRGRDRPGRARSPVGGRRVVAGRAPARRPRGAAAARARPRLGGAQPPRAHRSPRCSGCSSAGGSNRRSRRRARRAGGGGLARRRRLRAALRRGPPPARRLGLGSHRAPPAGARGGPRSHRGGGRRAGRPRTSATPRSSSCAAASRAAGGPARAQPRARDADPQGLRVSSWRTRSCAAIAARGEFD